MRSWVVLPLLAGCATSAPPARPKPADEPLPPLAVLANSDLQTDSALSCSDAWALWERYADAFVEQGRVIDRTDNARSTSEGQSYGLFFALVANDRERFDAILEWTIENLAGGNLARNLPAWLWGRDRKGRWRILDPNAASDADLWIAYSLLEGGRLWSEPRYVELGRAVLDNAVAEEVRVLPGLGPVLLPAPVGFEIEEGRQWRLNPSYLPMFQLRRFEQEPGAADWGAIAESTMRMMQSIAPRGYAPDWVLYDVDRGFGVDPDHGARASYDAIRVYLWAGLTSKDDPNQTTLTNLLYGPHAHFIAEHRVEEVVDFRQPTIYSREGPPGFFASLIPGAMSRGDSAELDALQQRLQQFRRDGLYGNPPAYYDQNLVLFANGFSEGRYRFAADGTLQPKWSSRECSL
ncbi:MAG: cellulose synthase complex periplasmic endoglucanase BcsZ [Myxococcota bacterium]